MPDIRELTCIGCPLGCAIKVQLSGGAVLSVEGNSCKIGADYAVKECTNPTRILTSTVKIKNGTQNMLPVKTKGDIPKEKIFECMKLLKGITVCAPSAIGDIIIKNACATGVDIVAAANIEAQ